MTRLLATIAMMRYICARRCVPAKVAWILALRMFAMIVRVLSLVLIVAGAKTLLNTLTVRGNLERCEFEKCTIMPYFKYLDLRGCYRGRRDYNV